MWHLLYNGHALSRDKWYQNSQYLDYQNHDKYRLYLVNYKREASDPYWNLIYSFQDSILIQILLKFVHKGQIGKIVIICSGNIFVRLSIVGLDFFITVDPLLKGHQYGCFVISSPLCQDK